MGIIFGRTQTAQQTPFDATNPAAIAAGLSSTDVFNAIIEAKNDALNNDRYPVAASYGGNAGTGRRLEIFPGISSDIAPLVPPENSNIVAYSFGCVSASTGVIAVRNITTGNDLLLVTFTAQTRLTATGFTVTGISALDEIEIYVKSGSFNKPFGRIWLNTVT